MTSTAPVVLMVRDGAEHVARTLEALGRNELAAASELIIDCDGPRTEEDGEAFENARREARAAAGFKSVRVVERDEHFGVDRAMIAAVTSTLDRYGRVIVLDQDMVTSVHFLRFMNDALERYADDDRVISVCGYTGPVDGTLPETFFLPGAHCWGWATWRRGWALFENDARKLLREILSRGLVYTFDFQGAEPLTQLLARSIGSPGSSWTLRWMGSAVANGKLTLYPGRPLVRRDAQINSVHGQFPADASNVALSSTPVRVDDVPVEVDQAALDQLKKLLVRWRRGWSRRERAYYALAGALPAPLERALYSARVSASLRRHPVTTVPR